jgi:hypothetical protein
LFTYTCWPVVEQHQDGPEVPPATPEFDIKIDYFIRPETANYISPGVAHPGRRKTGWRYVLEYDVPEGYRGIVGRRAVESNYGYQTMESAKRAAEYRADQIALSLSPTETYKYTPKGL